jgi:hypothetical protein
MVVLSARLDWARCFLTIVSLSPANVRSKATLPVWRFNLEATRTTKAWNPSSIMLFREDLEEILRIFRSVAPDSPISIEDEETQYPSFDEVFAQKGPNVVNLRIINAAVGVKLQLRRYPTATSTTTLATTKISDDADLTFYRAKEFLEVKRRPSQYWLGTVLPALCISIIPLFSFIFYLHRGDTPPVRPWGFVITFVLALATVGLFVGPMFKYSSSYLVTLKREREAASFFKRNRDRFLMSLLFFGLGIVVTLIVQYFK